MNAQKYAHDLIGNLNNGLNRFIDWNLILDNQGGPNHVKNFCDAPYLFNTDATELIETNILPYLWHFSHFIAPGAVRIASSYTDRIEATAFEKDDQYIVILLNRTEHALPLHLRIYHEDALADLNLPPRSICSCVIKKN